MQDSMIVAKTNILAGLHQETTKIMVKFVVSFYRNPVIRSWKGMFTISYYFQQLFMHCEELIIVLSRMPEVADELLDIIHLLKHQIQY